MKYASLLWTPVAVSAKGCDRQFVEIFVCFFCENEFTEKTDLQHHQRQCTGRPPDLSTRSRRPVIYKRNWSYMYKPPQKKDYFESLGLVSLCKADVIRRRTDSKALDLDVDVIDLEDPTFEQIPTPSKSPRPIFCRRGSSTVNAEPAERDVNDKDLSDNDSSKSDAGSEIEYHPRKSVSLLSIDVTSVLGQRVKRHVKLPSSSSDNNDDVFGDNQLHYEKFCRTPVKAKGGFIRRLRQRGGDVFPVTFRKTRRTLPTRAHTYTFSRRQQWEIYRRLETGLDARSRALRRCMRRCRVVLRRLAARDMRRWVKRPAPTLTVNLSPLTPGVIARWCTPEKGQPSIFPSTPDRLSLNDPVMQGVLGLKTRLSPHHHRQRRLTLSQVVSEDVNAEVQQQKAIVYRTVLSEISAGGGDGSNPADLTPPATPEDDDVSHQHDLRKDSTRKLQAPNENMHPRNTQETGKGVSQATDNYSKTVKMARTGRQIAALRTLVGCPENAMAGDAVAAGTGSQALTRTNKGVSPARTVPSKRSTTNGNVPKASPAQTKRCLVWDASRSSNARYTTQPPQADDVVLISDDEATPTEAVSAAQGKRQRGAVGRPGPACKRRKTSETLVPDMRFNCHLCGESVTFNADVQTYITQHFADRHGVPNIQLVRKRDDDGRMVMTIVEGTPPPPPQRPSYRSAHRPSTDGPVQQRHAFNKTAPTSPSSRRLTRRNSVRDNGITTRAGTTVRRPTAAPVVDFICID